MNVIMVGTGYVGLVTGTCLAEIGHKVICVDIDKKKIDRLIAGEVPIYEPGLEELIQKNTKAGNLSFSTKLADRLNVADIVFIAVGTPSDEYGRAEMKYVWEVAEEIGKNLKKELVVVNKSTVPVGTATRVEEIIQKHYDNGIHVVSCPEFLREGVAVDDFMKPDRIVVGARTEHAKEVMGELFAPIKTDMFYTSVESAEMIKYASNSFLATKISFINEISNICEKVGADVEEVAKGMGKDKRIGPRFLRAGLGYGGSCFPKDVQALDQISGVYGYHFRLLQAAMEVNSNQKRVFSEKIEASLGGLADKTLAVFGLAFKNDTDDIRESASLELIKNFLKGGATVHATDPKAMTNTKALLGDQIAYFDDIMECAKDADAIVIATEWDDYKKLSFNELKEVMKTPLIFDGRNVVDLEKAADAGFSVVSIGRKPTFL